MTDSHIDMIGRAICCLAVCGLVICVSASLAAFGRSTWAAALRALEQMQGGRAVFAILAILLALYGGSKPTAPTVPVVWDDYFADRHYEIATNDPRRISFSWSSPAWMPAAADAVLRAFSRSSGVPPMDGVAVTNVPMAAGAMSVYMPWDATNYAYYVECDWIPGPSVVTNGVYHVRAVKNNERITPVGVDVVTPARNQRKRKGAQ